MGLLHRRSRIERLRDRGDVPRLVRRLERREWMLSRDGGPLDLAVGQRLEAVAALGAIATPEAETGLLRALDDDDMRVRHAALDALGRQASDTAAPAVARALAGWRDPQLADLRDAALDVLAGAGDTDAAVAYAEALANDPERPALDAWEESALARLFADGSGPAAAELAEELALRLSDESEPRSPWQALVGMGATAVPALVAALDDPARRTAAASALGAIRDARAVAPLTGLLTGDDAAARAAAARALGAIRDPRAVPVLVQASADPDAGVRDAAMDALDRMRTVVLAMLGGAALEPEADARGGQRTGDAVARRASLDMPRSVDARAFARRLLGEHP